MIVDHVSKMKTVRCPIIDILQIRDISCLLIKEIEGLKVELCKVNSQMAESTLRHVAEREEMRELLALKSNEIEQTKRTFLESKLALEEKLQMSTRYQVITSKNCV